MITKYFSQFSKSNRNWSYDEEYAIVEYLLKHKHLVDKMKQGNKVYNFWNDCQKALNSNGIIRTKISIQRKAKQLVNYSVSKLKNRFQLIDEDIRYLYKIWDLS